MKRLLYCLLVLLMPLIPQGACGQSINSKGGSFKGGTNPFTDQVFQPAYWNGSGIALDKYHVATNNHVVESQTHLSISFSDDDERYSADVIATDEENDLAIIYVSDPKFPGFKNIRYGFNVDNEAVGEDVFVLGYPIISYMGTEVKLTTGVISARSGYKGDKGTYQISAPVQPGNSGGPLFNSKGELIGIVSSKLVSQDAENVSYAIKLSLLSDLIKSSGADIKLNKKSKIASQSLSKKCKATIPYTVRIMADNSIGEEATPKVFGKRGKYPIRINDPDVATSTTGEVKIVGVDILEDKTVLHLWAWNNSNRSSTLSLPESTVLYYQVGGGEVIPVNLLPTGENPVGSSALTMEPFCYIPFTLTFETISPETTYMRLHFDENADIAVYWWLNGTGNENDPIETE